MDNMVNEVGLQEELKYFSSIKKELLKSSPGKYALIKGEKLLGTFDTESEAYSKGIELLGNVPFLIKEIIRTESIDFIPILSISL